MASPAARVPTSERARRRGFSRSYQGARVRSMTFWSRRRFCVDAVTRQAVAIGLEWPATMAAPRSEEHTSELQSRSDLVCRLLLEKKKKLRNSMQQVRHEI